MQLQFNSTMTSKWVPFQPDAVQERSCGLELNISAGRSPAGKTTVICHLDSQSVAAFECSDADSAKETPDAIISRIVSKRAKWQWDASQPTQSYYDFVYGNMTYTPKKKRELINGFVEMLKTTDQFKEIYTKVAEEVEKLMKALDGHMVFRSVIKLIKHMRANEVPFHIFLRASGSEGAKIAAEIQRELTTEKFNVEAEFENDRRIKGSECHNKKMSFTQIPYGLNKYYNRNGLMHWILKDGDTTKRTYWVDLKNPNIMVMVAKNILDKEASADMSIISADSSSKVVPFKSLQERGWVVGVEPYDAIMDEEAYIKAFKPPIEKAKLPFTRVSSKGDVTTELR